MAGTSIPVVRLDSWKDIASYLHCDVRTAIRWEKAKGLPVHRVPGGQRHGVFAYSTEIEAWLASGSRIIGNRDAQMVSAAPVEAETPAIVPQSTKVGRKRAGYVAGGVVAAMLLLMAMAARVAGYFLAPGPERITGFTQVSHDGLEKAGLLTDGAQLYFGEERNGRMALASMPIAGGSTRILWNPPANVLPEDVSPDGRQILALTYQGVEKEREIWIFPVASADGATPQRLGSLAGHSAAWSPDGKRIAYATGNKIHLTADSGVATREIGSFNGIPDKLRWSPNGEHLRFLLLEPNTLRPSYWELVSANGMATTTLSALPFPLADCCDIWSPLRGADSYFLVSNALSQNTPIWLLEAGGNWWRKHASATELQTGLKDIGGIAYSQSTQRMFVLSQSPSYSALLKFDPRVQDFRYILPGVSGLFWDYSRNGQSVAYVRPEDSTLWVSRADGSEARQLTYSPKNTELPRWSPDGKWIAYTAKQPGKPWRIFIAPLDGGSEREASEGDDQQGAPTWSPDGKFLVYGNVECMATQTCAIRRIDLATGRVQTLPGSDGLATARWSPDGRYVAALQPELHQLFLFDMRTQQWRKLADAIDGNDLNWSNDSRFIYASCLGGHSRIVRIPLVGGKVETVVDLRSRNTSNLSEIGDAWFAIALDGSILLRYWQHASEIYAYHLQ